MARSIRVALRRFYKQVFPYSAKDAGVPGFARSRIPDRERASAIF